MKRAFLFFLLIPFFVVGQSNLFDYPRDTSYSIWSAAQKIKKDFPQAVVVQEFQNKNIAEKRNVVYDSIGKRDLHADLFYPKKRSDKKLAAVLLIHGGGWASGNKSHLIPMAQKLAENGFFTAAVESRLSPEAKYPAGISDLKTAVKWLKINAGHFNVDTSKIAVLGTSSGATLATFLGTTGSNNRFPAHPVNGFVSDKVQAIINIDGIVDFTDPAESAKDNDPQKPSAGARWFGATYQQNPELWIEGSPLTYVSINTPPTLFINSSLPRFHAGRDEYLKVLKANNIFFETYTIPETPHTFWLFYPWFDQTYSKVITFLTNVFH